MVYSILKKNLFCLQPAKKHNCLNQGRAIFFMGQIQGFPFIADQISTLYIWTKEFFLKILIRFLTLVLTDTSPLSSPLYQGFSVVLNKTLFSSIWSEGKSESCSIIKLKVIRKNHK